MQWATSVMVVVVRGVQSRPALPAQLLQRGWRQVSKRLSEVDVASNNRIRPQIKLFLSLSSSQSVPSDYSLYQEQLEAVCLFLPENTVTWLKSRTAQRPTWWDQTCSAWSVCRNHHCFMLSRKWPSRKHSPQLRQGEMVASDASLVVCFWPTFSKTSGSFFFLLFLCALTQEDNPWVSRQMY